MTFDFAPVQWTHPSLNSDSEVIFKIYWFTITDRRMSYESIVEIIDIISNSAQNINPEAKFTLLNQRYFIIKVTFAYEQSYL